MNCFELFQTFDKEVCASGSIPSTYRADNMGNALKNDLDLRLRSFVSLVNVPVLPIVTFSVTRKVND